MYNKTIIEFGFRMISCSTSSNNCLLFDGFLVKVSNKIVLKEESASEKGTSFADMTQTENSNAKKGPTKDFNAFKDFHESETVANILAAWMHFTGMDSIEGKFG